MLSGSGDSHVYADAFQEDISETAGLIPPLKRKPRTKKLTGVKTLSEIFARDERFSFSK